MTSDLRVSIVSWNAGGCKSLSDHVISLLEYSNSDCDILIIGLQEASIRRRHWRKILQTKLNSAWVLACSESYGGMRIIALVKKNNAHDINFRSGLRVGVGIADRFPNKGAVAVELEYGSNCRVCFVCSHLAASEDESKRNIDLRTILKRMDHIASPSSVSNESGFSIPLFHRYDHVFFFGDLNYRITPPCQELKDRFCWVKDKVDKSQYTELVSRDQLTNLKNFRNMFTGFQEAEIDFAPTYKMSPLSNEYNISRIPSYCDRILWHSLPSLSEMIECLQYNSIPSFLGSDHRPVEALFRLKQPNETRIQNGTTKTSVSLLTLDFQLIRILHTEDCNDADELDNEMDFQARRHTMVANDNQYFTAQDEAIENEVRSMSMPPRRRKMYDSDNSDSNNDESIDNREDESTIQEDLPENAREIRYNRHPKEKSSFPCFYRSFKMEVHGNRLFQDQSKSYKTYISMKDNGYRERKGDRLPTIPLSPVEDVSELQYEHIILVLGKSGSSVGHSGVIPLSDLIPRMGQSYTFVINLTKYGLPGRRVEVSLQLIASKERVWKNATGQTIMTL